MNLYPCLVMLISILTLGQFQFLIFHLMCWIFLLLCMPSIFKNWIPDFVIFIFFGFWIFLYNYKYSWASFGTIAKLTGDKWFFCILLLRLGRCEWTVLSLGLLFPTKEASSSWVLNAPDLWGLPVCLVETGTIWPCVSTGQWYI